MTDKKKRSEVTDKYITWIDKQIAKSQAAKGKFIEQKIEAPAWE